jgi:transposase
LYWKKSASSGSEAFIGFLTQIRQKDEGKEIVLIADNASIHKSRKVKK